MPCLHAFQVHNSPVCVLYITVMLRTKKNQIISVIVFFFGKTRIIIISVWLHFFNVPNHTYICFFNI